MSPFAIHHARRYDVREKVGERHRLSLRHVRRHIAFGEGGHREALPRLENVHDHEADREGKRCHNLEVQEGLPAHASHAFEISHVRDTKHDREKDDRRDHHLDEIHECIPDRLHLARHIGRNNAEENSKRNRDEDLDRQIFVEAHAGTEGVSGSSNLAQYVTTE
jgi:hypothetical protein